jgi:hypothetical protein
MSIGSEDSGTESAEGRTSSELEAVVNLFSMAVLEVVKDI